jgi:hypothetical protein
MIFGALAGWHAVRQKLRQAKADSLQRYALINLLRQIRQSFYASPLIESSLQALIMAGEDLLLTCELLSAKDQ